MPRSSRRAIHGSWSNAVTISEQPPPVARGEARPGALHPGSGTRSTPPASRCFSRCNWFILLCAVMAFIGIRAAVIRREERKLQVARFGATTISTSAAPVHCGPDTCGDREGSA